jgi:uncharacterized protein with von Willebrand factor type A (vWA) domain
VVESILEFVRVLRGRGLVVAPTEVVDALRGIAAIPEAVGDRELFEAALAGTLVKRSSDLADFREAFAAFFLPDERGDRTDDGEHGHDHAAGGGRVGLDVVAEPAVATDAGEQAHEHGRRIDLRRFFGEGSQTEGHDHHAGDRWRLTWLGTEQVFDRAGRIPTDGRGMDGAFGLRRVMTLGRPGSLQANGGIELPRDVVLRPSGGDSVTAFNPLDDDSTAGYGRRLADAKPPRFPGSDAGPLEGDRAAWELGWDLLTSDDLQRLNRAIERLGRRLGGAPGRGRPARGGRLDARRTVRRAAATDGVPFLPVYQKRQDDRPRLTVLCDVSLSVRGAARFLLAVARSAQRQSGRVRSFVFVRQVAEVTRLLVGADPEQAIGEILGGRLLDTAEGSDAGSALKTFAAEHGGVLSRQTTLLILGDGRNNGRESGLEALEEIRRRCRRVIWLTPEARGTWRLAGCDLPRYATRCDLVAPVRTPAALERIVLSLGS